MVQDEVKWLLAVRPEGPWNDGLAARFDAWARHLVDAIPVATRIEAERLASDEHRAHAPADVAPYWPAFVSLWTGPGFDPVAVGAPKGSQVDRLQVRDELRHAFSRDWPDGVQTPGVKKTTLWRHSPQCEADWQQRYQGHARIVLAHHSTAWQYRQNIVESDPDGTGVEAVSELWWPDAESLLERYYNSEESRQAVAADVVFVDRGSSRRTVTAHWTLKSPEGAAAVVG